jgi:hypothetical protein
VPVRVFTVVVTILLAGTIHAPPHLLAAPDAIGATSEMPRTAPTIPPDETFNDFLPEERGLGECISAIEKPGCGSESRGGWRQSLVALALVLGLAFIAWRIVRSVRRTPRPPDAPE